MCFTEEPSRHYGHVVVLILKRLGPGSRRSRLYSAIIRSSWLMAEQRHCSGGEPSKWERLSPEHALCSPSTGSFTATTITSQSSSSLGLHTCSNKITCFTP